MHGRPQDDGNNSMRKIHVPHNFQLEIPTLKDRPRWLMWWKKKTTPVSLLERDRLEIGYLKWATKTPRHQLPPNYTCSVCIAWVLLDVTHHVVLVYITIIIVPHVCIFFTPHAPDEAPIRLKLWSCIQVMKSLSDLVYDIWFYKHWTEISKNYSNYSRFVSVFLSTLFLLYS